MEENNGNVAQATVEPQEVQNGSKETVEPTMEQLKEICSKMYQENIQMRNALASNRAVYLFKVVEDSFFNKEFKEKAAQELEAFLYPKQEEKVNEVSE
jgi:predicted RNA-binding protein